MDIANLIIRVTSEGAARTRAELNRLRDEANQTSDANTQLAKSMGNLGKYAAVGLGVLGAGIGVAIKKAQSFETAMAEINKTVDFTTANGLGDLKKELIELSRTIPIPFEELAAISAAGGQAGVADKNLKNFTETIAKMAIAFDISASEAADSMAKIASSYSVPIENVGDLGDAINTLSNNSASKAQEIIDFMLRVGSASKNLGIAGESAAAMGALLIDAGIRTEVAGTAVSKILNTLGNNDGWSKSQIAAFDSVGLNSIEFFDLIKSDGQAAFDLLRERVQQANNPMGTLSGMFGEAGNHASALFLDMGNLEGKMSSVGQGAEKTTAHLGSMQSEFEKMSATSANAQQLFENMVSTAVASIGEAFLPVLNQLLLELSPIVDKITVWAQANPELIRQIALVTATVLGSIVALVGIGKAVETVITTFNNLKTIFSLGRVALMALSGPIGLTVIGLGILVAAGLLVYQNWDIIKAKAIEIWGAITSYIGGKIEEIKSRFNVDFPAMATIVGTALKVIWELVKGQFSLIKISIETVLKVIMAVIKGDFGAIPGIIGEGLKKAWEVVKTMMGNILTIIKDMGKRLYQIGADMIRGLVNGIKSGVSSVTTAISSMAGDAVTAAKNRLGIKSPSRVFKKLGEHTSEGMALGIKKGAKAVKSEADKMAEGALKTVKSNIKSLEKEIALFGNTSKVSEFDYDKSKGAYAGVSEKLLGSYRDLIELQEKTTNLSKIEIDLAKDRENANLAVANSIADLQKKRALFGDDSALSSLRYDIEFTDKYKDASAELVEQLQVETAAFEKLGMVAKATAAIKERFAKFEEEQASSKKALDSMMAGIQQDSPMGKIQAEYDANMAIITRYENAHTGIIKEATAERLAVEQLYMNSKRDLMLSQGEALFGAMAGMAKSFVGEQSGIYRTLFGIEKSFALAQAGIAIQQTIAQAMKAGFPNNIPLIGQAISQGSGIISTIKSISAPIGQAHDGIMTVPKSGTWNLEKGEQVLPQQTAKAVYENLVNGQKGNENIVINVTVTADGNSEMQGNTGDKFGRKLAEAIKATVRETIMQEKRQGRMLSGS